MHVVKAATSLLATSGYGGFTLEAVALAANVDRSTLRHHFPSKAALLLAVFDNLQVVAWEELLGNVRDVPLGPQRLVAYVRGLGSLIADPQAARGLFELAAPGLTDPVLAEMFADRYAYYRRTTLELAGVHLAQGAAGRTEHERRLDMLAALILAALDGFTLQLALDPQRVDADLAFGMLAEMIERQLTEDPA